MPPNAGSEALATRLIVGGSVGAPEIGVVPTSAQRRLFGSSRKPVKLGTELIAQIMAGGRHGGESAGGWPEHMTRTRAT